MLPQRLMTRPDRAMTQRHDFGRSLRLFAAFRKQQIDPDVFHQVGARDTADHSASYLPPARTVIVDGGGSAGYFAEAMRASGAPVEVVDVLPRYLPSWTRPIVAVPGLRELLTWNLVLVLRKR